MSRSRLLSAASLMLAVPLLAACGGGSSAVTQAASAAQSVASQAASAASSAAGESPSETPSETPTTDSSPAPSDSATVAPAAKDLCAAVDELKNMGDTPKADDAKALHQAAADIAATAPAEVADGAKAYAAIIEFVATELDSGSVKAGSGLSQAVAQGMGKDPKAITNFILYVSKNCAS
jgi:hypothetical protein